MTTKLFDCSQCGAYGKITVKGNEHQASDIVYCPVCSADIYEEEDDLEREED